MSRPQPGHEASLLPPEARQRRAVLLVLGGAAARCTAEVQSATRGITLVTCPVADDPQPYRFLWDDLRRDALRPEDDATRRRLVP